MAEINDQFMLAAATIVAGRIQAAATRSQGGTPHRLGAMLANEKLSDELAAVYIEVEEAARRVDAIHAAGNIEGFKKLADG